MKHYSFEPSSMVCCYQIDFDIDDDSCIHNLKFSGGCNGNLTAIGKLCEGLKMEKAIELLSGIRCGSKPTSCTDQFARALQRLKKEN